MGGVEGGRGGGVRLNPVKFLSKIRVFFQTFVLKSRQLWLVFCSSDLLFWDRAALFYARGVSSRPSPQLLFGLLDRCTSPAG